MKTLITFIIFFTYTSLSAQQQAFNFAIEDFTTDSCVKNSPISIYASNAETGQELLNINGHLCITPASVLKLITTATALEVLGPNYKFSTTLWYSGTISGDTLYGDIVITGGGDPTLGSQYFNNKQQNFLETWAEAIIEAGILYIEGNIVADPYIYPDQDVPQSWVWEDLGNYYGAAAQGINLYDNTFRIIFDTEARDGGETIITNTIPFIPNLEIENYVTSSIVNRDRAYVYGSPFDSYRIARGTLPLGRKGFSIRASIPDPALLLALELSNAFLKTGIEFNGIMERRHVEKLTNNNNIIFTHFSPTLQQIVIQTNYESSNLFAESLCKYLGHLKNGLGSTPSGVDFITKFWNDKGINAGSLFMADGSGLSRYNATNSKTLVEILSYMHKQSAHSSYFIQSVPLAGINGTQQFFFQNSFLKGKARAKTGSMTRVRSLAGYMNTQNDTPVSFSIITNNFNCSSFVMATKLEKILEAIYTDF